MSTDTEGCAILRAERELQTLEILLANGVPLTDVGRLKFEGAIAAIRYALRERRAEIGLPVRAEVAA